MDRCVAGESYRIATTITLPDGSKRGLDFSLTPVREDGDTFAIVAEARELLSPDEAG
jgi:hypothetical protein